MNGASRPPTSLPAWGHLRALWMPALALVFVVAWPARWWSALGFMVVPLLIDLGQGSSPSEPRQPAKQSAGAWPDVLVYVLAAIHLALLVLAGIRVAETGASAVQAPVLLYLLISSSGVGGASAAHVLIHRRARGDRLLGRLLLCTLLYDHFATEHLRGHHLRAGTAEDPSTARYDEPFWTFCARTVPGQLWSALALSRGEAVRGLIAEGIFVAAYAAAFGGRGLLLLGLNAAVVHVVFAALSYVEHWGLAAGSARAPTYALSWDTTDRGSLFSMLGVGRHADHHAHPRRPYHQLRHVEESPKLPHALAWMLWMAMVANGRFRRVMREQMHAPLERRPSGFHLTCDPSRIEAANAPELGWLLGRRGRSAETAKL